VTEKELQAIRGLARSISSLVEGEMPEPLSFPKVLREEIRLLCEATNDLIADSRESHHFIGLLGRGDLDVDPPARNSLCSPYKQLHANLRHLVWQTQQVAKGDLSQQVDFLGGFADAFNSMILSLREKRSLEAALRKSHEELELRVAERTAELTAINEQLKREIIERKSAEERLERALADLTRINNELRQFAYASSHDLKEPLHNLTICVQRLERLLNLKAGSNEEKCINWAVDSAARMAALIDDILAFSRLDSAPTLRPTDSEKAYKRAVSNLRAAIEQSGAVVTHDRLPMVRAHQAQLVQVFHAIIDNAIKFRRDEPPRIHVSATLRSKECELSICDNGIGIEPEYLERIFLIFKRLHSKQKYPGTGMGLAIAKKIVEGHGGRIWVESTYGEGSKFRFTVPSL
jgi:light-regulated signal transduction histidine kinase (bacteriophytochrome)